MPELCWARGGAFTPSFSTKIFRLGTPSDPLLGSYVCFWVRPELEP